MPRNRPHLDRDGKRSEIVAAAAALFAERGFEQASVAAIAARAQITKNTIYWYFDDKDALLIAVISDAVRAARGRWETDDGAPLADKLAGLTAVFDDISSLTTALHARLDASASVRAWHDRFHAASDAWLRAQIVDAAAGAGLADPPEAQVQALGRVWSYAIEGMVIHRLPAHERAELCEQLVGQVRLLGPRPSAAR
ncbi:MAG: TetR/AcrR family transcriptional regulator [Patulibacter minatonensis]